MSLPASIIFLGSAFLLALSGFTLRLRHKYLRRERELETARAALERAYEILRGRVEELEGGAIASEPESDIEKQRQRVEELATRLSQANEELETFSYSVSHDLRAPLRSIDGFSRELLIGYEDKLDDKGKHYLTRVRQAARRMSQLIDDMLNLSRLSRKAMRRTSVDLTEIIEAVAAEAEERAGGRRIGWKIEPKLRVHADPHLIRIVFENLIGNAVKFTASRSEPRIEIGRDADVLFVRDNGVGFDPEYAQKLFAPFQRLHGSEFEGTGIGLAIVQRVIHRHDGRVWAESAPDRGATFRFTLGGCEEIQGGPFCGETRPSASPRLLADVSASPRRRDSQPASSHSQTGPPRISSQPLGGAEQESP
jgi:signal transduction histidine kinase